MINILKRAKETINRLIYDSAENVLSTLKYLVFTVSLIAFGILIYYYGFPHPAVEKALLIDMIKSLFLIYIINFFIRWLYSGSFFQFLSDNWFEGLLVVFLLLDACSMHWLKTPVLTNIIANLNLEDYHPIYVLSIQAYMMILAGREIIRISQGLLTFKVKPAILLIWSFILLIVVGAAMLMMPEMTVQHGSMNLLNALFTSVSATCVTGLIVVDTATFFTLKGQIIILILMQLGGIGIITFASFFALSISGKSGIKQQTIVADLLNSESTSTARELLSKIIFYTLFIELIGAVIIFSLWIPDSNFFLNQHLGLKIYYSIFHSVSAFCNAGFSLFSDNLMNHYVAAQPILQLGFALLIVLGGLGFPALQDLFGRKALRDRMRKPWKSWQVSTKVAVYSSIALIIFGSIFFFVLEYNNTLTGESVSNKVIQSIFQSVTTRTAGFNTVDIGQLATPTIILFIFLMFIGGSSGSTAGGIKTSTFVIILTSVYATIRGKKQLEFSRRAISFQFLNRAFSIVAFASFFVLIALFLLTIFEPEKSLIDLMFETFSAFGTVGLSRGITSDLSAAGKWVIIICMFIGRIGTLTLAFALSRSVKTNAYKYPLTHMMVG